MFRKHPLRDFMLFLLVGITLTFSFNARSVDTVEKMKSDHKSINNLP